MPEFVGVEAQTLAVGDALRRGQQWWVVETATVEPRKLGGPVVVLRCRDEHAEVREFSLPADLGVVYRRAVAT